MSRYAQAVGRLMVCLGVAAWVGTAPPAAAAWPAPQVATVGDTQAFDCADVTEIPQSECEGLQALYNATDGPDWHVNTGWLQTATPCGWYGVICADGHVSKLDLNANGLRGPMPAELGDLIALLWLDLTGNPLSGTIPPRLGRLANLQFLNLSGTGLSGAIPPEVGRLTSLQILALGYTNLGGVIPPELGNLAALRVLSLNHNRLSGSIPPELGNLAALEGLSLSENQLSGAIPPELGKLTNLGDLYLNDNQLSGAIPPELGNLTNIRVRWSTDQAFGVQIPPPINGYLDLSSNRLSGAIPVELSQLSAAAGLDLSCNQLSGPLPPAVGRAILGMYTGDVFYNLLTGYDPVLYPTWYWYETQTVPPTGLRATADASGTVILTWTPIPYTADGGFYEVSYATAPDGPFLVHGWTTDKTASSYTVTGLRFDGAYYFRVRTFTAAHPSYWCNQQSALASDYSAVVSTGGGTPTPSATSTPTATVTPTATPTPAPVRLWLPLVRR